MNTKIEIPSWKTGIIKRLRQITMSQILDALLVVVFFSMMIFMMVTPIILALYAPPTVEFSSW